MFSLENKIALITGATGGIGKAIAETFANAGAKVVLTGRNKEKLEELNKQIKNSFIIPCDLSTKDSTKELIKETLNIAGKLDILINNAGITKDTLCIRMKDEDWQEVIDVNLSTTFKLARDSIMPMIKNKFGRIINITSVVGCTGNGGQTNYAASKAGIIGFTKSMAIEVASRNITVNSIAPGFIKTAMTDVLPEEIKNNLLDTIPIKKFGEPQDVANAALFLASDEASYITGQTLHVNGGMYRT